MYGKHKVKVYSITFNAYTNCLHDTVSNGTYDIKDAEYMYVGRDPLLIREDEIEKYRTWGGGIKDLHYVGNLIEEDKA